MNTKNAAASKKRGRRYEFTDDGWEPIESLPPKQARGGRWADHRTVRIGMFWVLNGGAPWRDMPERHGRWETVYGRFRRWTDEVLIDRILRRLHVSLDADGRIDWSVFDVDGSSIRARVSAAGGAESSNKSVERSRTTWARDDPAEPLAPSFILRRMVQASRSGGGHGRRSS